ncbi:MAG: PAS domain S-box protein, partial [Thermodesulfobacteriota bacterium]
MAVKERTEVTLLGEINELYRTLIESAGLVIVALTVDRRIVEFNVEAEKLFGAKREDVLGKDYLKLFIPEESRADVAADIVKVLSGESTQGYENPVISKDGTERIVLWNVSRHTDSSTRPVGIIAIGQDITDRKAIE